MSETAVKETEKNPKLGNLPGPGPGRPKGLKNKYTNLKNVFLEAFEDIGGKDELVNWIKENKYNKRLFYQWITKMLPSSIEGDIRGDVKVTVEQIITDTRPDE